MEHNEYCKIMPLGYWYSYPEALVMKFHYYSWPIFCTWETPATLCSTVLGSVMHVNYLNDDIKGAPRSCVARTCTAATIMYSEDLYLACKEKIVCSDVYFWRPFMIYQSFRVLGKVGPPSVYRRLTFPY